MPNEALMRGIQGAVGGMNGYLNPKSPIMPGMQPYKKRPRPFQMPGAPQAPPMNLGPAPPDAGMPTPGPGVDLSGLPGMEQPYDDQQSMLNGMGQPQNYAQGGVVDQPTTAVLGESGPEMVIPLSGQPGARVGPGNIPQMQYRR